MNKKIIGFKQMINGKMHTSYHVVPEIVFNKFFNVLTKASVGAFPTFEEADVLAKEK